MVTDVTPLRDARLVVLQGPIQALTATATCEMLDAERRLTNIALIGGLAARHERDLEVATIACAGAGVWEEFIPEREAVDVAALRAIVKSCFRVVEVLCIRNWQPINEVALDAFPEARRINYGDALGLIDEMREPGRPRFELAAAVLPQPEVASIFENMPVRVVPVDYLRGAIRGVRQRSQHLARADAALAEFARGGVLLLGSYLTESRHTTLTKELDDLERRALEAVTDSSAAVVIKPHPRASLGQVAEVARRLRRRGHAVRILTRHDVGLYPVELFCDLASSVALVEPGLSSSCLSLRLLHDAASRISPHYLVDNTLVKPHKRARFTSAARHYDAILELLPDWNATDPLPALPPQRPSRFSRLRSQAVRAFDWRALEGHRERTLAFDSAAIPEFLNASRDEVASWKRWIDAVGGTAWLMPGDPPAMSLEAATVSPADDAEARLLAQVRAVVDGDVTCLFAIVAAVIPPSHAPLWEVALRRVLPVGVPEPARLTAEDVEECLEAHVDVVERIPLLHRRFARSAVPKGHVAFLCRVRAPASSR